jgi:hypothetical protein
MAKVPNRFQFDETIWNDAGWFATALGIEIGWN